MGSYTEYENYVRSLIPFLLVCILIWDSWKVLVSIITKTYNTPTPTPFFHFYWYFEVKITIEMKKGDGGEILGKFSINKQPYEDRYFVPLQVLLGKRWSISVPWWRVTKKGYQYQERGHPGYYYKISQILYYLKKKSISVTHSKKVDYLNIFFCLLDFSKFLSFSYSYWKNIQKKLPIYQYNERVV